MNNLRWYHVGGLSLAAFVLIASLPSAPPVAPRPVIDCFNCGTGEGVGCSHSWEHVDFLWFNQNNWQGGGIHSSCTGGVCSEWHSAYSQVLTMTHPHPGAGWFPEQTVVAAQAAVKLGEWSKVAGLIQSDPLVHLNVPRRAVQIEGEGGVLVAHFPLPDQALEWLAGRNGVTR